MLEKWYYELENKFPDKKCHQMVIMPNHFHCIIENLHIPVGRHTHPHWETPLGGLKP